jgi:acyl-coenzyme A synthetase/AMP-(fatty) acid ligase
MSAAFGSFWIDHSDMPGERGGPRDVPYEPIREPPIDSGGLTGFERIARLHASRIAVDDGVTRLTYAELLDRVYGLANALEQSTRPGDPVASILHNRAAGPIVILASALMGRVLIPIDAGHPRERQVAIFAEAGARAVIVSTDAEIDQSIIPPDIPRITIDPGRPAGCACPASRHDPAAPMIVIFTSGSTGRPKGLAMSGATGASALAEFVDAFHINENDVILGIASLSTGGARDALAALSTGARIRIIDLKTAGVPGALRVLAEEGITILGFVPSVLRNIMRMPGVERSFRTLRILDLYGEQVLSSDIALFRSKLPANCLISVTLAATETGKVFSWFVRDERLTGAIAPVGYVVPGKQVALLGEDGQPVAPGEVGELMVRGAIAMGGWRGGRLTDGPFLPDPGSPGSRIYAMGDLARLGPDGLAEYVGRRDRRIKIRGLWADLGEIEAAIRGVDGVADAVVIAKSREGDPDILTAFVTHADSGAPPAHAAIRRAVASETAEHMVPGEICEVASIPRLANYKPDLARLNALAGQTAAVQTLSPLPGPR